MKSRIKLLDKILEKKQVEVFIITSPRSIQHLCGYFFSFETGPSPFHFIPAALVVIPSQGNYLVIADNETGQLQDLDTDITVVPYVSYTYEKPLDCLKQFTHSLHQLLKPKGRNNMKIGIEPESLPYSVSSFLTMHFPGIEFIDITRDTALIRLIKDPDELKLIREATHLCDIGQAAVLKYARPGMTELGLFTLVRGDMDSAAGKSVPMMADLVSGERTGEGGGNPSGRVMKKGDLILSDLTPCLNGYWGDTCNTIALGKPRLKQRELFLKIKETLELGISAIRPGARASEIDRILRKHLAPEGVYNHHSGHGVGLAYHEEPRIVPYNDTELRPNMVITLEPGIYAKESGIRLEHIVVVTRSGCEILSKFDHRFEQT
jgi:Xaa-Pro dipeptidase